MLCFFISILEFFMFYNFLVNVNYLMMSKLDIPIILNCLYSNCQITGIQWRDFFKKKLSSTSDNPDSGGESLKQRVNISHPSSAPSVPIY